MIPRIAMLSASFGRLSALALLVSLSTADAVAQSAARPPDTIYVEKCAACHGPDRLGGTGPALIPETLYRMKPDAIVQAIGSGRAATQMPAFANDLTSEEIVALSAYIKAPLAKTPTWSEADITRSRLLNADYRASAAPVFTSDRLNLFLVVETGDHHVSVLDGDTFERLHRFATPFAVHGGPKFTPDGRFVFIMSRDGWVQKYDIWSLREVGRIRAGLNARNIAISRDGKWLAVANYLPRTLTILATADLSVARIYDVADRSGAPSRVSAVYQAPTRDSFILALKDVAEIWEIATGPQASAPSDGVVHGTQKSLAGDKGGEQGLFARRRITVSQPLDDFFFDPDYRNLIGAARDGAKGVVVDLTAGREIAELPLPGMPHLGSGISWMREGKRVMATPHLKENRLSIINVDDWSLLQTIETLGPGFFMRSHETSPYVWADVFFGPNKDALHVIDKQSLAIVATLRPAPGKTVAHIEFDRHGKYALASVWEDDGAVIVYDAHTLKEVRRIAMRKPSGKYNIWNKITFSEGTSH